ncbi:MAG: hypothetical protein Q7S99_15840 [Parvibaculum sp.]|nr:hypothetical protein [Parvibaculum sp.]
MNKKFSMTTLVLGASLAFAFPILAHAEDDQDTSQQGDDSSDASDQSGQDEDAGQQLNDADDTSQQAVQEPSEEKAHDEAGSVFDGNN